MPQSVKKNAEDRMEKAIGALRRDLTSLRAGRATPSLIRSHSSGILRSNDTCESTC